MPPRRTDVCVAALTVQQPAALVQCSQVAEDETGHDVVGHQLTLIDAGLHQQAELWHGHTCTHAHTRSKECLVTVFVCCLLDSTMTVDAQYPFFRGTFSSNTFILQTTFHTAALLFTFQTKTCLLIINPPLVLMYNSL